MSKYRLYIALVLFSIVSGCGQPDSHRLIITGSSTIAPIMAELATAFEAVHSDWRIDVQSGGSSRGISDVRQGLSNAGMVSRSLADDEQDLMINTLAYDGIAIIIHADNPVASLSKSEIRRIYQGEINNWSDTGGRDMPIMVINKATGRGTLEVFLDYFGLENQAVQADLIAGENQQVIQTVAGNPAAVGYVSIGTAEYEQQNGTAIKLLPLSGVAATSVNLRSGEYPLSRPLNVITRGTPRKILQTFIAFWQTPAAHDIIRQHYFVPATP